MSHGSFIRAAIGTFFYTRRDFRTTSRVAANECGTGPIGGRLDVFSHTEKRVNKNVGIVEMKRGRNLIL